MIIMITAGVYGHNDNGRVRAVRAGDPPIEVPDHIGERLVRAGVAAQLVDEPHEGDIVAESYDERTGEITYADESDPAEEEQEAATDDEDDDIEETEWPDYDMDMTRPQLEDIGRQIGLDEAELKAAKNKGEIIAMLDAAKADYDAEGDAPDLDPAAAIQ